ncbi:MAG: hypothetical protein OXN17_08265 [Candidatus Poribacteria bacterium]|nr:hypothetical protein [Candidatus Poribacteria bacterium]MDE0505613.1 hypothetical protein [Candidatus Poribacteria bacterium]
MIEKIFVPTIKRIPARQYINLGALTAMGFPYQIIEYFPARDRHTYLGDAPRAVNEALKEGFKLDPGMVSKYSKHSDTISLKWFCMRWTFTMIFQKIMNIGTDGKYYKFLIDDFRPMRPFREFRQMMSFVDRDESNKSNSEEARIIVQLDVFENFDVPRLEREPIPNVASKVLVRGLGGAGDGGLVMNKEGARILYDRMCETGGGWNLEGQLWRMAQEEDQSGFYSVAPPHYMIKWIDVPLSAYGV